MNANAIVRYLICRRDTCHKFRGGMGHKKMAHLPQQRCIETGPFSHCGVDMFGLFIIKGRKAEFRRYAALFTCFSSRAVHIEITSSSGADYSSLALRLFILKRGLVGSIWSKNGSNFVVANN